MMPDDPVLTLAPVLRKQCGTAHRDPGQTIEGGRGRV
jgi:hypothetical protein